MREYVFTALGELTRTLPPPLTKGPLAHPVLRPVKTEWLAWLSTPAKFTPRPAFA